MDDEIQNAVALRYRAMNDGIGDELAMRRVAKYLDLSSPEGRVEYFERMATEARATVETRECKFLPCVQVGDVY